MPHIKKPLYGRAVFLCVALIFFDDQMLKNISATGLQYMQR